MARLVGMLAVLGAVAAGCGSHGPSAYAQENTALLARVPVYPGASAPQTSSGASSNTEFGARDWTLPAATPASTVVDWYVSRLRARGWTVTGKSFDTIRATRGNASLSVGVRGRTLEVIANSRGA
jgi:hypothetical protein